MKLVAFVGSMRGKTSITYNAVESLINKIKSDIREELTYTVFCADELKIEMCRGCMLCYQEGCCINDDIQRIEKEILDADIVVLGSPVYVHQVTGPMKNFVDRLNCWCYELPLLGKLGITVSVSNTNGNYYVDQYLNKVMDIWGANIVSNISIKKYPESNQEESINIAVEKLLEYLQDDNKRYKVSKTQEIIFQTYKEHFKNMEKSCLRDYWERNALFEFETVCDWMNKIQANSKGDN